MKKIGLLIIMITIILAGCSNDDDTSSNESLEYKFSFNSNTEGWQSFFSDYPPGEEQFYELKFDHTNLPDPLDKSKKALQISGNNHSDDLFSAVYRKFEGLEPNKEYAVTFDADLASNAPTNAVGVGGSPDLSLGAGGISYPPENTIIKEHYRANFESRLQSGEPNEVFKVIGTIGVSDEIPTPFMMIKRNNLKDPIRIKSNSKGEIWLMITTDSGFEATTTLYYTSIKVRFD